MKLDKRLLRLIRSARLAFYTTIGLGFTGGILVVVQAWVLSRAIGQVFLFHEPLSGVTSLLGVLMGIFVLRAAVIWGGEISGNHLAVRIKSELRTRLFRQIQSQGPLSLQSGMEEKDSQSGALINATVEGIEALDAYFSKYLPQVILAALIPLTYLAVILPLDPLSGAVLLLTAPLIPLFMILIGDLADSVTEKRWETLSRMSAYFLDVLQGLTTLKILGRSRDQIQTIHKVSEGFRETTMGVLRVAFLSALALELVATLSTAIVAVEIGLRLLGGRLSFEQAFFVLLLAPEFYLPLRALGTHFHAGMAGFQAVQDIYSILEQRGRDKTTQSKAKKVNPIGDLMPARITFDKVAYAYPDGREALRDVSMVIVPNQKTALVGPSGAGKTTLAYLLLGVIEPSRGEAKVNGTNLQDICEEAWLDQVSWVSQHPYLFNDTIEANIRLAHSEASQEAIIKAARLAYAHEFVEELPEGYDTIIGERGVRISAGQAQRIALARAFLKDAPVLVLDEASANLDPDSEAMIQAAIHELSKERTVLIIAHRLSTVKDADQIVLLDQGEVKAVGKHADLLKHSPLYCKMVRSYAGEGNRGGPPEFTPTPELSRYPRKGQDGKSTESLSPDPGETRKSDPTLPTRQVLLRLLGLLRPYKGRILVATWLGVATVASAIGLMTTSAYLISAAALQPSIAVLQVPIVGVRFFGLARGIFRYLERVATHDTTFRVLARLRVWVYEGLEPLVPGRLSQHQSGDLLSRVTGDIEALENFYIRAIAPVLTAMAVMGLTWIFMVQFHAIQALSTLFFLILAGAVLPILVRRMSKAPGRKMIMASSKLKAALVDGIQGNLDLKVFGGEDRAARKIYRLSQDLGNAQIRMAKIGGMQAALMNLLANMGAWTVLILTIPMVSAGEIEGIYLAVVVLGAMSSFEAILPLPLAAQTLESSLEGARRIFELVDRHPEIEEPNDPLPAPREFDLEVENLNFRYPDHPSRLHQPASDMIRHSIIEQRSRFRYAAHSTSGGWGEPGEHKGRPYTLDGITFRAPQGYNLAIVGPSGAGKSTLVNLLLRFWEYEDGEIRLDGEDMRRYSPDQLRKRFAVVDQNTYLFNATIRDNLRLAKPKASEAEIEEAAEKAQIHTFIRSLPLGYETWVGEHGLRLSAGQRQRLAIARGLLKEAPILILDEPTANLDPVTERAVLQSIFQSRNNRTTLLITHRLVEMERMDEILVLDRGCIVERGKHKELLLAGGIYRRMWERQVVKVWNQVLVHAGRAHDV